MFRFIAGVIAVLALVVGGLFLSPKGADAQTPAPTTQSTTTTSCAPIPYFPTATRCMTRVDFPGRAIVFIFVTSRPGRVDCTQVAAYYIVNGQAHLAFSADGCPA